MKWIAAILLVVWMEWVIPFSDGVSWQVALGAKYLTVAILFQAWLSYIGKEPLLLRSAVALLCVDSWVSFGAYVLWTETQVDAMAAVFLVFTFWLFFILKREYSFEGDGLKKNTVALLLFRPRTTVDIVKAFVGLPVASVCVVADNSVFAFRRRTGKFEKRRYSPALLKNHVALDTGVACNDDLLKELGKVVGSNRTYGYKCVYSIRHVLNRMGGVYSIKSWADYVPGLYASRLLARK